MRRVAVFAIAIVALHACGSEKAKPPPPPTDGIELVNAGREPRRLVRYKLAPSSQTELDVAMDVDMRTVDRTVVLPSLVMSIDVAAGATDANGAIKMKASVVGGSARPRGEHDPAMLHVMERQAATLVGLVMTFDLSPWGQVSRTKVEATGRDLSEPMQQEVATLTQLSEQLAMALPDKPIGPGAIWKHRRTIRQNQLTLVTMTTVEVTAIAGDAITFKSTTEMTGADQTIAQGSATAQVTAIRGTGTQTGTFDLAKAVVLGTSTASLSFELIAEGQHRPNKLDVVTTIGPREKPPEHEPTPGDGGITDDAGVTSDGGAPAGATVDAGTPSD
jgi:hypothetical protein